MQFITSFFTSLANFYATIWNTVTFHSVAGEILVPLAIVTLVAVVQVAPPVIRRIRAGR